MRTTMKEVQGIDWRDGAVMNCRWEGPRLRDVLRRAGVVDDDDENYPRKEGHWAEEDKGRKTKKRRHVQFGCHQTECQEDGWFGSSIELNRAMSVDAEVILALKVGVLPNGGTWDWSLTGVIVLTGDCRGLKYLGALYR